MTWLDPVAWWGLAGLTVPVLIHLLARFRSRRVSFPSLRFLQVTQMTAVRRRVVSEWPLLVVRGLIIVTATAALAAPVFVSPARRASWDRRVARALVLPSDGADDVARIAGEESRGAFVSAQFKAEVVADGLRDAVEWLNEQPPAAREVVIIGDFREGSIVEGDLRAIPPFAGVRLLPAPPNARATTIDASATAEGPDDRVRSLQLQVSADQSSTRVRYQERENLESPAIHMIAAAEDQPVADAILRAVLRDGVWLPNDGRTVTIAFAGSSVESVDRTPTAPWMQQVLERNPEVRGVERDGGLIARVNMRATEPRAATIAAAVIRTAFATSFDDLEPRRIAPSSIARWSRPAGPSPPTALPADEGDRRWLWLGMLALLGVEQLMRGGRAAAADGYSQAAADKDEVRVA